MKKEPKQPAKPAALTVVDLDLFAAGGAVLVFTGFLAKSLFVWIVGV